MRLKGESKYKIRIILVINLLRNGTHMIFQPQFSNIVLDNFTEQFKKQLNLNLNAIEKLLTSNNHTFESLMIPLDDIDDELSKLWSPISHLHSVANSAPLRKVYQECIEALSDYSTSIGQNKNLYEAVKSVIPNNDIEKKILLDEIKSFELSGVALTGEKKALFKSIQAKLSKLTTQFENNILDATNQWQKTISDISEIKGLPAHALATAKEKAHEEGSFVLTLDFPCFHAVMTFADNESLRKELYEAYITRASEIGPHDKHQDNTNIIKDILKLRQQKASLLGFKHYAELSLAKKMAPSTARVMEFLLSLSEKGLGQAKREYKSLEAFAKKKLSPWDVSYYSEKQRQKDFNISEEMLRPYFPVSKVICGLFEITQKLYGISLREKKDVDTWHPDVRFYELVDEEHHVCGGVYMDFFARKNKRGGAWMDECVGFRKLSGGKKQKPVAFLTCNFAPPAENKEACLSHDEVVTLFHEFGHCLHHLLTNVDYLSASGINGVEWDAVELPSQFFENYCWHYEALLLMSSHIATKEPLPKDLYQKLLKAKNFQSAMALMRQLEFSLFDFTIHMNDNEHHFKDVLSTLNEIKEKYSVTPSSELNRFPNQFSHIFAGGYAAGYYSYKWAEVLACDVFSRFEEEGIFSAKVGHDFLNEILSRGSSRKAIDNFIAFRGREPSIDPLLHMSGIEVSSTD